MDLSLVTIRGRHEICHAKFSDIKDGYLRVIREKAKNKNENENEMAYMEIEVTKDIERIIFRCRSSAITSPYIIHRDVVLQNSSKVTKFAHIGRRYYPTY